MEFSGKIGKEITDECRLAEFFPLEIGDWEIERSIGDAVRLNVI